METKKQENIRCSRCRHYNAYYHKMYCQFSKKDWGFCEKQQKSVECSENCELWEKSYTCRRIDRPVVIQTLKKALTDIAVLRQIFEEETQRG